MAAVRDLISEPISPLSGTFDATAMGRGEPGLPRGFAWRGRSRDITEVLSTWKDSEREGGRASAELYLRRHYYRLKMSDGSVWTVYFARQAARSGNARIRWFLYTVES